jgi:hypothetical protein
MSIKSLHNFEQLVSPSYLNLGAITGEATLTANHLKQYNFVNVAIVADQNLVIPVGDRAGQELTIHKTGAFVLTIKTSANDIAKTTNAAANVVVLTWSGTAWLVKFNAAVITGL